eukprot:306419_1
MLSYKKAKELSNKWFGTKIPEEELKQCEGFNLAQEHLLHRIDQQWNDTLPMKYKYDQSLRKARIVWFEHFMGPVAFPTVCLVFCSHKFIRNVQLKAIATFASFAIGASIYMSEFNSFDIDIERTYQVLLCPTPIGKECRDILQKHNPDHWILDKYEINAIKLRTKLANKSPGAYYQWYNRKRYSEDIFEDNMDKKDENDDNVELDEEIYGDSTFIPEYPLPKTELTYATTEFTENQYMDLIDNEEYDISKENIINSRPESRFMKKDMWPKALIEHEEFKKKEDKQIFRDFGVDIDNDNDMKKELLSEIPKTTEYTDEKCWQIEEDWR